MEIIPNFGRRPNIVKEDPDLIIINDDLPLPSSYESTIDNLKFSSTITSCNRNIGNADRRLPPSISFSSTSNSLHNNFQTPEEIQVEPILEYYQNGDEVDYSSTSSNERFTSSLSYSNYEHNIEGMSSGGIVTTPNNEYNMNENFYMQSQQEIPGFHYQEPEENFISIDDLKAKPFLFSMLKKEDKSKSKDVVIIDDDDNDDDDDGNDNNVKDSEKTHETIKRQIESRRNINNIENDDDDDVILIEDDEEEINTNNVGKLDWTRVGYEEQEQDKQTYECFLCNKKVASNYNLRRHMMIHTGERPFGCDICLKRFREFSDLKKHRRVHCHEKEYKCMICKKNIPSATNPTKCVDCDVEDRQSRTTSNHGEIVLSDVPCIEGSDRKAYVCPVCDRIFGSRHNLKRHYMIHTGEKPYKCDVCAKSFREVSTLKKHMLTHTRIKLFKCSVCGREYSDFATYTRHKNLSHPYQNTLVSTSQISSASVSGLFSKDSNDLVISSVRSGTGSFSALTAKHSSSSSSSSLLNSYGSDYDECLFECSDCYKKFSNPSVYKEHLKLHSRDFTFQCYICKKMFRNKEKLNAHFVTHDFDEDEDRSTRIMKESNEAFQRQIYVQQQQ